jgi:hypothetical protein
MEIKWRRVADYFHTMICKKVIAVHIFGILLGSEASPDHVGPDVAMGEA